MSTDTFDITKLSRAMIQRAPWINALLGTGIKDNGVFVKGVKLYEDRNHSKAGC